MPRGSCGALFHRFPQTGNEQSFGAIFDHLGRRHQSCRRSRCLLLKRISKAVSFFVLFLGRRRLASKRLVRVLITLGENGWTFSPSFSLGRSTSRGRPSGYGKARLFGQRAPTAPADLPAQRVRAQVPAAVLEPALLPGSAMPAAGPTLAGGAAAGQTSPERRRQSPACPGRTRAPPAGQVRVSGPSEPRAYAGAWSRSRNFFSPPLCDRPGCHEPPVSSPRNPARYCCPACRQAVRNVQDRERKWLSRGTLDGRKKRAIEYQAARRRRALRQGPHPPPGTVAATSGVTIPPGRAGRQLSRGLLRAWFTLGRPVTFSGAQACPQTHSGSRPTAASPRNRLVLGGPSLRARARRPSLARRRAVVLLPLSPWPTSTGCRSTATARWPPCCG